MIQIIRRKGYYKVMGERSFRLFNKRLIKWWGCGGIIFYDTIDKEWCFRPYIDIISIETLNAVTHKIGGLNDKIIIA